MPFVLREKIEQELHRLTSEGIIQPVRQPSEHVIAYIDDILVTGPSEVDNFRNLEKVLFRLSKAGVRLKKEKCKFLCPQVEYLGHLIDEFGLHPTASKVQAILDAPTPNYLWKSFTKFIPSPFYLLLQERTPWS